jgi:hypothetical protein
VRAVGGKGWIGQGRSRRVLIKRHRRLNAFKTLLLLISSAKHCEKLKSCYLQGASGRCCRRRRSTPFLASDSSPFTRETLIKIVSKINFLSF